MSYIDREYYISLFEEIPDAEFKKLLQKAELRIKRMTHNRVEEFWRNYKEETATLFHRMVYDQIRQTECEVIHALYVQESSGMGDGIASVSNDGYSESYKIATNQDKEEQLDNIVRSGLSGTGLAGAL